MNAGTAPRSSPSCAVAFGGGGARGLAHIHAVEALDEMGIRPVAIAGSSIGAIIGAGMAAGMSGRDIHDYARSVLGSARNVAGRMWRASGGTLTDMMRGGLQLGQFDIERILGTFLPEAIPQYFEDLRIPLKVTATDYFGHELVVFSEGELHSALAASAAIPAIFRPVERDGRVLLDGGIYNPVPFDLLHGMAEIVIAVDVVGGPVANGRRRPNAIDLMLGATQLMMQSITAAKLVQTQPDVMLRPPVSRFRALDFLRIDAVMAETASIKDELKRAVESAVEARRNLVG
ncbi:MAG: Patatin [Rhizobiaceae bacterium]|nr:Patatin [Rhizobiaceae bacterium]